MAVKTNKNFCRYHWSNKKYNNLFKYINFCIVFIGFYQHQNKLYSNTASMMFCSDWSYCDGWGKMRVRGRWAGTDSGNGKSNQAANKIKGLTLRDVINDISTLCEEIHQSWANLLWSVGLGRTSNKLEDSSSHDNTATLWFLHKVKTIVPVILIFMCNVSKHAFWRIHSFYIHSIFRFVIIYKCNSGGLIRIHFGSLHIFRCR